jgi:hypothetical protein
LVDAGRACLSTRISGARTRPLTLPPDLAFTALNSAFEFRSPTMPGEPMRVQPSRAKKPADDPA